MSIPVIGGPGFNGPGAEDDPMVSGERVIFGTITPLTLWRRANARNVSFKTLYGGQFTLLTRW